MPFKVVRVKKIISPVAIFVLAIVAVPATSVPVPLKSVTAPPFHCNIFAAVAITRLPPVILTLPDPELIVVVDVVLVEPNATVFAAAPVAMLTVVAAASLEIDKAPVPDTIVKAPFVAVIFKAPEPDCTVVADVVLVEPRVTVLTPAPVARETVVAAASVDKPSAPVPELPVHDPFVDVNARAPEPD